LQQLLRMVESGMESAQIWELAHTHGASVLLSNAEVKAPRHGQELQEAPQAYRLLQGVLERLVAGDPDSHTSAISAHRTLAGLIAAAQAAICQPDWFLDPTRAVVIAADEEERDQLLALLRQPMAGQGSDEDPLEAAQWVAEELMPPCPGWKYAGPPPVRLASEIGPEDSFLEVFLSPRCRELTAQLLLPSIRAVRVGLHVVREGGEAPATAKEKPRRQWDWEEQNRKQERRLAALLNETDQAYRARLDAAAERTRARQARLAQREVEHLARTDINLPS
jgi:hypothetical protein